MLYIELEGTDTTGKTTTCQEVCRLLSNAGYNAAVVPPARKLLPNFMERLEALDPIALIEHELDGYRTRRLWAASTDFQITLIDRGLMTLAASSRARLLQAKYSQSDAQALVVDKFAALPTITTPTRRYLLSYDNRSISEALAIFRAREEAPLSAHYLDYQRLFLQEMNRTDGPVIDFDLRFDACVPPSHIHQKLLLDVCTMTPLHKLSVEQA